MAENALSNYAKALELVQNIHINDTRKNGESLFDHLKRVSELLQKIGVTEEHVLIAALMHQSLREEVESAPFTPELKQKVSSLVTQYNDLSNSEMSSISPKDFADGTALQAYLNLTKNPEVLLIRLADKVDNIKTAFALDSDHKIKVAEKALYLYAPLCKLLGIYDYYKVLENEAFKILNPKEYYKIDHVLREKENYLKITLEDIKNFLQAQFAEMAIKAQIDSRIKHHYSIYRKAVHYSQNRGIQIKEDFSNIYDVSALRILVDTIVQCYEVEDVLKQLWKPVDKERDDYIANSRPSGYKSIHNAFRVAEDLNLEIQIKTHQMHEENEFGMASHIFYKLGSTLKKAAQNRQDMLKELNFYESHGNIKIDHFSNKVYVFTPKGDIVELPKGVCLIDFAYAIHSSVGRSCYGGLVNGQIKPLKHQLKDGDLVKILTKKNQNVVSIYWLDYVKTSKARDEIKAYLRTLVANKKKQRGR